MQQLSEPLNDAEVRKVREMIEQHPTLANDVRRTTLALLGDGNGNAGLVSKFNDFLSRQDERRRVEAEMEQEKNSAMKKADRKWNLRIAAMGLVLGLAEALHGCGSGKRVAELLNDEPPSVQQPQPQTAGGAAHPHY